MGSKYQLKKIDPSMGRLEYDMFQEIPRKESGAENVANGLGYDVFSCYLKQLIINENRVLDDDGTPVNTYIMYVNDYPVGNINIRTRLNDYWKEHSGNIYYKIRPSERKKGYGAKMLSLALDECRSLGFSEVLLQSSENNIASAKTIESNGGILLREDGSRFYKINLIKHTQ